MSHAVEQHSVDCDHKCNREDDSDTKDNVREYLCARDPCPASRESKPAEDWGAQQENEDQFGQRKDDMGRKVGPRQVGSGDETAGKQGGEWKALMREESERSKGVLNRIGLPPRPKYQHYWIGHEQDRQQDPPKRRPSSVE